MQTRFLPILSFGLALALGATGCASPCQDLGYRVCQCEPQGQTLTNCQNNVKARVRASSVNGSTSDYCNTVLSNCPDPNHDVTACGWMLNTCAGRVACGLALPTPGGGCSTLDPPPLPASTSPADEADDL